MDASSAAPIHPLRAVDQVKRPIQIVADRLQTASTAELEMRLNAAHQADILDILVMAAMLYNQIGTTLAMQWAHLAKFATELDSSGLIAFVKLQIVEFQFPNTDQHSSTGLRLYLSLTSQLETSRTSFHAALSRDDKPRFSGQVPEGKQWRGQMGGSALGQYLRINLLTDSVKAPSSRAVAAQQESARLGTLFARESTSNGSDLTRI